MIISSSYLESLLYILKAGTVLGLGWWKDRQEGNSRKEGPWKEMTRKDITNTRDNSLLQNHSFELNKRDLGLCENEKRCCHTEVPRLRSTASITAEGEGRPSVLFLQAHRLTCQPVPFDLCNSYHLSLWSSLSPGHTHNINLLSGKGFWPFAKSAHKHRLIFLHLLLF